MEANPSNMEKILNLFPIFEDQILKCIGFRLHEMPGSDDEKLDFLRSRIDQDKNEMAITLLPEGFTVTLTDGRTEPGITLDKFNVMNYNGTEGVLYEGIYRAFDLPEHPLSVITPIVNGQIKFNQTMVSEPNNKAPFISKMHEVIGKDYLEEHLTEEGLDMGGLMNSDFFNAIHLTFETGYYVSCLKLLLSAIDSIAYLEYGDKPGVNIFEEWLKSYCDFGKLNITERELWEYRNSMLHMTNSYSRKVVADMVSPLKFYVSPKDRPELISNVSSKYFNVTSLLEVISKGVDKWTDSFNNHPEKSESFIKRYDLINSDSRYNHLHI